LKEIAFNENYMDDEIVIITFQCERAMREIIDPVKVMKIVEIFKTEY